MLGTEESKRSSTSPSASRRDLAASGAVLHGTPLMETATSPTQMSPEAAASPPSRS